MHLENAIFSSEYTIPVTTLPDLSCQNSPTLTTFAQTFEQYSPIKQYSIQNESRTCQNYFNFLENTPAVSQIINETINDQTNDQYGCLLSNQEQMKLEKQFTSAFLDSVQTNDIFDANYSEQALEATAVAFPEEIQNHFENYIFAADDNWKKHTSPINETQIFNTETNCSQDSNPFFVQPPFQPFSSPSYSDNVPVLSPLNLPDDENSESLTIDLDNDLSNGSFDFNLFSGEFEENQCNENQDNCELENVKLASMFDAFPNNCDFSNFLRNASDSSLIPNKNHQQLQQNNNAFGHLLSTKSINNNLSEEQDAYPQLEETQNTIGSLPENQIVLTQNDAILGSVDPFLSSTYYTYEPVTSEDYDEDDDNNKNNFDIRFELETKKQCLLEENDEEPTRINRKTCTWKEGRNAEKDNTVEEAVSTTNPEEHSYGLQCKWMECYENFNSQECLVRHIERFHVEIKKGDEFSCYWENCPRKNRPFNARYKLLIHMRVHSGEKPNKCPWPGCEKAFSRLENLKIHQRSHTGERPYRCQQAGCRKAFSNSSDRAKHQRTHVDTKPYACQVINCSKRYTDPSSLRKHVKNHSLKEQAYVKKRQKTVVAQCASPKTPTVTAVESEPTNPPDTPQKNTNNIKIDLKNKIINEKYRRLNEIISKKSCLSDFASMRDKSSSEQLTVDYDKNNEFIPYDSVKSLFSEQFDYIDLNL